MYKKIIMLLLILLPISAFANWNVTDKVDDFTDEKTKKYRTPIDFTFKHVDFIAFN